MINVLVTGGAGFIGSNFVRYAIGAHEDWHVTTLDKLTYAGRLENLKSLDGHPRHTFVHGDIADAAVAAPLVQAADYVVHFAAETHVDRSIREAGEFLKTDVIGTFVLLEAARQAPNLKRFVQISTDEVYGSVPEGSSRETDELRAAQPVLGEQGRRRPPRLQLLGHLRRAGDRHPRLEQLRPVPVPREAHPALHHQPDRRACRCPLYGDGQNVRDWLHVEDHCRGVDLLLTEGEPGEVYNIGGGNEVKNVDLTHRLLELVGQAHVADPAASATAPATTAATRSSTSKLQALGWQPKHDFEEGLAQTVAWYRENEWWWRPIKEQDAAFKAYYQAQYAERPKL